MANTKPVLGVSKKYLSEEMQQRIQTMALRTWNAIADDLLNSVGKDMPRSHVIECVCDAGYMLTFGQDKEAYEAWHKLPTLRLLYACVKPAFPHAKYGF